MSVLDTVSSIICHQLATVGNGERQVRTCSCYHKSSQSWPLDAAPAATDLHHWQSSTFRHCCDNSPYCCFRLRHRRRASSSSSSSSATVSTICDSTLPVVLSPPRRRWWRSQQQLNISSSNSSSYHSSVITWWWLLLVCTCIVHVAHTASQPKPAPVELPLLDGNDWELEVGAVLRKVAYGSTTKRSIPDGMLGGGGTGSGAVPFGAVLYPPTTLATPLLTTFKGGGSHDVQLPQDYGIEEAAAADVNDEEEQEAMMSGGGGGSNVDLERDHALPTTAPAAGILKDNTNKHYSNPNRHQQPYGDGGVPPPLSPFKTTSNYGGVLLRNVRPTKSMYSNNVPDYVRPNREHFTPPLPPEYQNPFADKPTLRGTSSDGSGGGGKRPFPPPSVTHSRDRIPIRPDLSTTTKVNVDRGGGAEQNAGAGSSGKYVGGGSAHVHMSPASPDNRKKTLNTPSRFGSGGDLYGLSRVNGATNESVAAGTVVGSATNSFEYEKNYAPEPSITRILSGSNGRHEDMNKLPDILHRVVTAPPPTLRSTVPPPPPVEADDAESMDEDEVEEKDEQVFVEDDNSATPPPPPPASPNRVDAVTGTTTTTSVPPATETNMSRAPHHHHHPRPPHFHDTWLIWWNVHVYLVVFAYVVLATYSIYQLVRYERQPHMFSKSYFLTIHLMLTVVCVLRIFYLTYDAYNAAASFNLFLYEFLHAFPLSLLAATFAVLVLFLLKRTLTHLAVKTRPVFLVLFALVHIVLCLLMSVLECVGGVDKASLIVCRPLFVLLSWALGFSYLYLYRIIKQVLAKKGQHHAATMGAPAVTDDDVDTWCTRQISYASHMTIAVALLFVLLGAVQLYALFFIKIDRFDQHHLQPHHHHHWVLWGYELSVRLLEITIIALLAAVVSLRMNSTVHAHEKHHTGAIVCTAAPSVSGVGGGGGFPLFPCTTSDSSTDNIYPNNCNTNPNVLNYQHQQQVVDGGGQDGDSGDDEGAPPPHHLATDAFDTRSTLERRYQSDPESGSGSRFENRHRWAGGSDRFDQHFRRMYYSRQNNDGDDDDDDGGGGGGGTNDIRNNIYSEPLDQSRNGSLRRPPRPHDFMLLDQRYPRHSTAGRRPHHHNHHRQHHVPHGHRATHTHSSRVQTLPMRQQPTPPTASNDSMLVDEQGFVRFRQDEFGGGGDCAFVNLTTVPVGLKKTKKQKQHHYGVATTPTYHHSTAHYNGAGGDTSS